MIVPIYCLTLRGTIIIPLLRHETLGAEKGCGAGRASIHVEAVHLSHMRGLEPSIRLYFGYKEQELSLPIAVI